MDSPKKTPALVQGSAPALFFDNLRKELDRMFDRSSSPTELGWHFVGSGQIVEGKK